MTATEEKRKGIGCSGAVAIGIGALVLLLYSVWPSDADMAAERAAKLRDWPEVAVTAEDWVKAWAENEVAAGARFDRHVVVISGPVASVGESNGDELTVMLSAGRFAQVGASVEAEHRAALAAVKVGDRLTLRCPDRLDVLGVRVLAGCAVEPASAE